VPTAPATARRGTYRVVGKIDEGKHAIGIRTIRHRADAYRTQVMAARSG
jgi:mRNA-degrading endonuclease RelE of RelBE toxin-antitoxin system